MITTRNPLAGIVDQTFVISLEGSCRRSFIDQHFDELGIDFEYFDAFDEDKIDLVSLRYGGAAKAMDEQLERPFRTGEVGCYFSHIAVMLESIRSGCQNVMICEDDVEFLYDPEFIRMSLQAAPPNWDLLHLHSFVHPGSGYAQDGGRASCNDYWRKANHEGSGAVAYIMNVRCMSYVLLNAFPMRHPIDGITKWPSSEWCDREFRCYIADPLLCIQRSVAPTKAKIRK